MVLHLSQMEAASNNLLSETALRSAGVGMVKL